MASQEQEARNTHASGVAELAARRAGELIRATWQGPLEVEEKGEADLVTVLDRKVEALIVGLLQRDTPDIPIIGEEGGATRPVDPDQCCWYVDPIDGTTNLAHGVPHFAVSIALVEAGEAQVGVVYQPIADQLFRAQRGHGAFMNGRALQVSRTDTLADALVATGFPAGRVADPKLNNIDRLSAVSPHVQGIRRAGSAALDLVGVAAGYYDAFWDCLLYTSPSPRDRTRSRMPSSA